MATKSLLRWSSLTRTVRYRSLPGTNRLTGGQVLPLQRHTPDVGSLGDGLNTPPCVGSHTCVRSMLRV